MRKKLDFWKDSKVCPGCKQDLQFYYYHKNRSKPYGIESRCKSCELSRKKLRNKKCSSTLLFELYNKIKPELGELDDN